MKSNSREGGFTVIELVIFFVILTVLAGFFVVQKLDLESSFADQHRKTAINAIYYNLTEVYFPAKNHYPSTIEQDTLTGIDPDMLYDVFDYMIGDNNSEYIYQGLNCNNNQCKEFRLTAKLDKEADYVIESSKD